MGTVGSISAALFLAAPPAPTPTPPASRVAVVAAGPEAAEVQRLLEQALAAPGISLTGVASLAPLLGTSTAARTLAPESEKQAAGLLEAAKTAYFEGRPLDALERLGALASIQEREDAFPLESRVRARLWRASAFLALNEAARADQEVTAALALNPDLVVDLNEFRPTLRDRVDALRATAIKPVTLVVAGLPTGAIVKLDGFIVPAKLRTTQGAHKLTVTAPGVREAARSLDLKSDAMTVSVSFALALAPAADAAVVAASAAGNAGDAEIVELRRRAGADWVVLASGTAAQCKAVVVAPDGKHATAAPAGNAALAGAFARKTVLEARAASAIAAAAVPGARTGLRLAVAGGPVWASRTRAVSDAEGKRNDAGFAGGGLRVGLTAVKGRIEGALDVERVQFSMETLRVHGPNGTQGIDGGARTAARVLAGWRQPFGAGDADASPSVKMRAGVGYTDLTANDVEGPTGESLHLLTSYTRVAALVAAGGRMPLALGRSRVALEGELAYAPAGTYQEKPDGATGSDPAMGVDLSWSLSAAYEPAARWSLRAVYEGSQRSVAFSGAGDATVTPAYDDATITETAHAGRLDVRWAF